MLRCIGAGGMGVVYEAVNRERRQRVALKTLKQRNAVALHRFKNEFRSAQSVVHPNVCALYELVHWEEEWFFTMEYVEGVSFTDYVRATTSHADEGKARLREALLQLARGVQALHEAGKLHRDLNASNVLVTADGRVVILDFGLISSEHPGRHTAGSFDTLSGTPGYMAPEQGAGTPASTASDWYAVGVMLYEALTGRLPFMGTIQHVLIAKSKMDPTAPGELCEGVPGDLEDLCLSLLRRAPKDRVGGEEVLRRLGGEREPVPLAPSSEACALIGRDEQLLALTQAYAASAKGRPVSVHVHGLSGMGKTALVRRFLTSIEERGHALVLRGRCYERESVPFKAFDSLIDGLAQHLRGLPEEEAAALLPQEFHDLARVFPVLQGVSARSRVPHCRFEVRDPQEIRRRACFGLKELLRRLGAIRPLILSIDDLQWGDADSAWLLSELLASPDAPALLLITTRRSDGKSASPRRAELRRPRGQASAPGETIEIEVTPLRREHAVELALRRMERSSPDARAIAEAIVDESDGSPFLLEELGRYAEQMRLGPGDGSGRISLEQLVEARLARLGANARTLLEVIATAGRPIEQGLAVEASGIGRDAHAALVQLRASHLIRSEGFRDSALVESYHDRLREAVLARLSPEARRARHLGLAHALSIRMAADPELLALHFAGASLPAEASIWAEAAAARAESKLAFDRAAELYRAALAQRPQDPSRARNLLAKRADALVNAGRGAEAAPLYLTAAEDALPPEALDLQRRAAEQLLLTGHVDEGVRVLRPVLEAHGIGYPSTPRKARVAIVVRLVRLRLRGTRFREQSEARISADVRARISVCWAAGRGLAVADPTRSGVYLVEALLLALRAGDARYAVPGLAFVGSLTTYEGTESTVIYGSELLRLAAALAARSEDPYLIAFTMHCRGLALLCLGEWRRALTQMDRSTEILRARCVGVAWERSVSQAAGIQALLALGELTERSRRAHAWLREANEIGDVFAGQSAAIHTAIDHLAADDPAATRADLQAAIPAGRRDGFSFQLYFALMIETWCDLYEGRAAEAFARIEAALREPDVLRVQMIRVDTLQLQAISAVALAARDAKDRLRLLGLAEEAAEALGREGRLHASAAAAVILAGVARERRLSRRAVGHLEVAAARYDAAEMKLHAASARRQIGALVGEDEGATLVAEADAVLRAEGVVAPERWARMYTGIG